MIISVLLNSFSLGHWITLNAVELLNIAFLLCFIAAVMNN